MRAIGFDLGDTLVEYEGVPLSWEAYYTDALKELAACLEVNPNSNQIDRACSVLRRYNTRIYPRTEEVSFSVILEEISRCFDVATPFDEVPCATSFFRIFRQRLRCFPDTVSSLEALRRQGIEIGVFTDVPYGMPRQLVLDDVREAGLQPFFDVLITSRDAGFRKPSVAALKTLAMELGVDSQELVYVGNEKKDVDVARNFGCGSILIDRVGYGHEWGQDSTIFSLAELLEKFVEKRTRTLYDL